MRSQIKGDYPLVVETSRHLVEAGGKRLRPLLTLLSAQFGDSTNYDIIKAAVCCELTHLATLYHDDVMDDAALRRGVISANKKWDNAVAILTGDYLFSKVSDMLADIGLVSYTHLTLPTIFRVDRSVVGLCVIYNIILDIHAS